MKHTDRFLSIIVLSVSVIFFLIIPIGASSMWSKTYGGPEGDSAYSLVQTSDGGYALAGQTVSFGAWRNDFWLVKLIPPETWNGTTPTENPATTLQWLVQFL